jgi:hypothetical protein
MEAYNSFMTLYQQGRYSEAEPYAKEALSRHFPDNPEIRGNRTIVPPPRELHPFRSHPMA